MTRTPNTLIAVLIATLLLGSVAAQRSATLSGVIDAADPLPDATRVGVQVVDADGAWTREIGTAVPVAGSFQVELGEVPDEALRPFRSGSVLLPGLQNEYRVEPEGVRFAQGVMAMYLDSDGSGSWTRAPERDPHFLALSQLERPIGFFTLLYVDAPVVLTATAAELRLEAGWNVFTVRFPDSGPDYAVHAEVDDVALEVLDLVPR